MVGDAEVSAELSGVETQCALTILVSWRQKMIKEREGEDSYGMMTLEIGETWK